MSYTVVKCKPHSKQWHALRLKGIGGSDASAVLGINPWRSPLDVWMEKTGRTEPKDLSDNTRVEWGLKLEDVIAKEYKSRHKGYTVHKPGGTFVSIDHPHMFVNPDRVVIDDRWRNSGLEIKTGQYKTDWFDGNKEIIPDHYFSQAIQYFAVAEEMEFVDFSVLISGHEYFERHIERAEVLEDIEFLIQRETEFWQNYVIADVAPAAIGDNDGANLVELYPSTGNEIALIDSSDVLTAIIVYQETSEAYKKVKALKEQAALTIKQFLGEHNADVAQNDTYKISWSRSQTTKFNKAKLKEDYPDLVAQYEYKEPRDNGITITELGE